MSRDMHIGAATAGLLSCIVSVPVMAHHPLGGAMPATALEGLLSGFGHPVIEFFHLVFLVGFGILLARSGFSARRALAAVAAFVAASSFGVVAESFMAFGAEIDLLVALTLLVLAATLWLARASGGIAFGVASLAAGAAHGLAFGEAVIGAEPTPIAAYLLGLALVEAAILWIAMLGTKHFQRRAPRFLLVGTRFVAVVAAASGAWMIAALKLL